MSKQGKFGEPFTKTTNGAEIFGAMLYDVRQSDGDIVVPDILHGLAKRIVDCLNACAGMDDPVAEIAAKDAKIAELEAQLVEKGMLANALEAAEDNALAARHSLYIEIRAAIEVRGYRVSSLAGLRDKTKQSDIICDVSRALEAAESRAEKAERERDLQEQAARDFCRSSASFQDAEELAREDRDEWKSRALAAEAKGPTREEIRAVIHWAVGHAIGEHSGPTMDNKFRSPHQITTEGMRRLFGDEKEAV